MNIDESARSHICDLEQQLEDCHVIIDLQSETISEQAETIKILRGQLNQPDHEVLICES